MIPETHDAGGGPDLFASTTGAGEKSAGPARRALILAVAAVFTLAAFALAFLLGAAYFEARRFATHEGRLHRMLDQRPTLEQVVLGLHDDGSPLLEAPADEAALLRLARRFRGQKAREIAAKGRLWPIARVFRAGDMIYFIFFDAHGVMSDFVCVSA